MCILLIKLLDFALDVSVEQQFCARLTVHLCDYWNVFVALLLTQLTHKLTQSILLGNNQSERLSADDCICHQPQAGQQRTYTVRGGGKERGGERRELSVTTKSETK